MKTATKSVLFVLLILCSSFLNYKKKTIFPQELVAPNHCKVLATVVTIKKTRKGKAGEPCSKAPCEAVIKINDILGYGSAFKKTLTIGEKIQAHFIFTLRPTSKSLFPNMDRTFPGLKKGDKFIADIESSLDGEKIKYNIYDYTLQSNHPQK